MDKSRIYPTNPLGIIALFVFFNETLATVTLKFMLESSSELATPMTWFIISFPVVVCVAFFVLLLFKAQVLYGPQDFRSDEAFSDLVASRLSLNPKLITQVYNSPLATDSSRELISALALAQAALSSNNDIDVPFAIQRLERLRKVYRDDRTIAIYLGRLYSRQNNFDAAILVLNEFIKACLLDNKSDARNVDIGDAYYNIACYYSSKGKWLSLSQTPDQNKIKELLKETRENLSKSIEKNQENKNVARVDTDFDYFRSDIQDIIKD